MDSADSRVIEFRTRNEMMPVPMGEVDKSNGVVLITPLLEMRTKSYLSRGHKLSAMEKKLDENNNDSNNGKTD